MSAAILPFKGKHIGGAAIERPSGVERAQALALYGARQIKDARATNDDWTAKLLLALLEVLDRKQLSMVEFRLLGPEMDSASARQALAIVQLANGDKAHREGVRAMLDRICGGGR